MALIAMAVYDTEENERYKYTFKTLYSLFQTVDFKKHRLFVIDNGSCQKTKDLLKDFAIHNLNDAGKYDPLKPMVITNENNIGTAEAINLAWKQRLSKENCIKMDNDVIINQNGWVDEMEEAIRRDPTIGQVGLKRKDCWESPERTDFYKSELVMLPHNPGEKWIVFEQTNHVMGTCVMHSSALLDKIGFLYQPRIYGFDDSLMSLRSKLAGFKNGFLSHIDIDHIDTGETPYQKWKQDHAGEQWQEYHKAVREYKDGTRSLYYNPFQI